MHDSRIQYLNSHQDKTTFVYLIISILGSMLLLFITRPLWVYDTEISYDYEEKKKILKGISWYKLIFTFILYSFIIYIIIRRNN